MSTPPLPTVGYIVHATRDSPSGESRVREYLVGLPDRDDAAGAVISADPALDDGYHVEASIGLTQEDADRFGLSAGSIIDRGEQEA